MPTAPIGRLVVEEAWVQAAGPELAAQTQVIGVRQGVVTIAVGDSILLQELAGFRRRELLEALRKHIPEVRDLRFRFGNVASFFSPSLKKGMGMSTALQQSQQLATETVPETPLLERVLSQTCEKIDRMAGDYHRAISSAAGQVSRAALLADGLERLREALTPDLVKRLMRLQGSPLGFQTDRDDKGGYGEAAVKEALVEALLLGVYPVGGEFALISGRVYITRQGFERLVAEIDGLTDLEVIPGVPAHHNGEVCVRVGARWKYKGVACELRDGDGKPGRVFPIRVNKAMGVDAILGKGKRKALAAVYQQVVGSEHLPNDDELEETSAAGGPSPEAAVQGAPPVPDQFAPGHPG